MPSPSLNRHQSLNFSISNSANPLQLLSDPYPPASYGHSCQTSSSDSAHKPQAHPYQGHHQTEANREWSHPDTDPFPVTQSPSAESPTEPWSQEPKSPQGGNQYDPNRRLERNAQRSVRCFNLPLGVRRSEITAVIRGGPLLEVHLRPKEHTAIVSFVYEDDAAAFLDRAREHGLRIRNTTVSNSSSLFDSH